MSEILDIAESIDKETIDKNGTTITVLTARKIENQMTSLGLCTLGLGLEVSTPAQKRASAMFSLDKKPIAGSIGRILTSLKVKQLTDAELKRVLKEIVGRTFTVKNKGGKLYWYP